MNARGIALAAYQVLHLLSYPGGMPPLEGGTPPLDGEYPIHGWGTPPPIWTWLGYPHLDLARSFLSSGPGQGTPTPRVWTGKQTETITFPILRMRAVITTLNAKLQGPALSKQPTFIL